MESGEGSLEGESISPPLRWEMKTPPERSQVAKFTLDEDSYTKQREFAGAALEKRGSLNLISPCWDACLGSMCTQLVAFRIKKMKSIIANP